MLSKRNKPFISAKENNISQKSPTFAKEWKETRKHMCVRVFVSGALYFGAKQPIVLAKQISLLFQQKKTISRKRGLLLPKSETRRENNSEPYISAQKSPMFGKSNKPFISLKENNTSQKRPPFAKEWNETRSCMYRTACWAKEISPLFQQKRTISRKRALLLPKSETRRDVVSVQDVECDDTHDNMHACTLSFSLLYTNTQ